MEQWERGEKVTSEQAPAGLSVELPRKYRPASEYAPALKISLA